jgi:hypothetical protein
LERLGPPPEGGGFYEPGQEISFSRSEAVLIWAGWLVPSPAREASFYPFRFFFDRQPYAAFIPCSATLYWMPHLKERFQWNQAPGRASKPSSVRLLVFLLFLFWLFVDVVISFIEVLNAAFPNTPL